MPVTRERAGVDAEVERLGKEGRTQGPEHFAPAEGDQQAHRAAQHAEQGALGEELADQPAAAGAQREADGDLAAARQGAGQQQVGHVGAGDQQQQTDDGGHHAARQHQGAALALRQRRLGEGHGGEAEAAVALRVVALEPATEGEQDGAGLIEARRRRQPGHAGEDQGAPLLDRVALRSVQQVVVHGGRNPDVRRRVEDAQALELRRRDAHDREVEAVQAHGPVDGARIGAEAALPQRVGEDGDRVGAGRRVLVGTEEAARSGAHAEHVEVGARNDRALQLRRLAVGVHGHRHVAVDGQTGEDAAGFPPHVLEIRIRKV